MRYSPVQADQKKPNLATLLRTWTHRDLFSFLSQPAGLHHRRCFQLHDLCSEGHAPGGARFIRRLRGREAISGQKHIHKQTKNDSSDIIFSPSCYLKCEWISVEHKRRKS